MLFIQIRSYLYLVMYSCKTQQCKSEIKPSEMVGEFRLRRRASDEIVNCPTFKLPFYFRHWNKNRESGLWGAPTSEKLLALVPKKSMRGHPTYLGSPSTIITQTWQEELSCDLRLPLPTKQTLLYRLLYCILFPIVSGLMFIVVIFLL